MGGGDVGLSGVRLKHVTECILGYIIPRSALDLTITLQIAVTRLVSSFAICQFFKVTP